MLDKIPSVKSKIINVLNIIAKKLPTGKKIFDTIIRSIDNVLGKVLGFIKRLFSREGLGAAQAGAVALGVHTGVQYLNQPKNKKVEKEMAQTNPDESDIVKDAMRLGLI